MGAGAPSRMPEDLARERGAVLHRALREVPTHLLAPLLRGTRRHADALVAGELSARDGRGCVIGMMLLELEPERPRRRRSWTIHDEAPEIVRDHPRVGHIEFIFDVTCDELAERENLDWADAAHTAGMWLASEVAAEINLRHMEDAVPAAPTAGTEVDARLFADTVARVRALRPWVSEAQAARMVESVVGARRVEPLSVPSEWDAEVELQRERLAAARPG